MHQVLVAIVADDTSTVMQDEHQQDPWRERVARAKDATPVGKLSEYLWQSERWLLLPGCTTRA